MINFKKYNIYVFIWDTTENTYHYTRINVAWPIQKLWPGFSPWLFGKYIGNKIYEK